MNRFQWILKACLLTVMGTYSVIFVLVACNSKSSDSHPTLAANRTFCDPGPVKGVFLRVDLNGPIAHFNWVLLTDKNEAPIVYTMPISIDAPWTESREDLRGANFPEDRLFVQFADDPRSKEEYSKSLDGSFSGFRSWLKEFNPKFDSPKFLARLKLSSSKRKSFYPDEPFASCDTFAPGLIKSSGAMHDYREFTLFEEQQSAASTPEGQALQQAVAPQLPVTRLPITLNDLTSQNWCQFDWRTVNNTAPVSFVFFSFSANKYFSRYYAPENGDFTRAGGSFMDINLVGTSSVQTKIPSYKDYSYNPEYFHYRDATGREYLIEVDKGQPEDVGNFRRMIPCNDEKVFAIQPSWRAKFAEVHAEQLENLKNGPQDFPLVVPYVDDQGVPQLKIIPIHPKE